MGDPGRPHHFYSQADAADRQRRVLIRGVRGGFIILIFTVSVLYALNAAVDLDVLPWYVPVMMAVVFASLALVVDLITPRKKISAISGVFLGIFAGLLATMAFSAIIDLLVQTWVPDARPLEVLNPVISLVKVLLGITLCYLGITTVLQTQDDFRLVIPYVEFAKEIRGQRPLLLDSSVLIDARLLDLAQTGFIQAPLVIPQFVVGELQLLADSADRLKRNKGRRGLDVISKLQRLPGVDVSIDDTLVRGKAVDGMLVELGRRMPGTVVTTDAGLVRVARIQNVSALNLNDVANALRPTLVPGEGLTLRLVRPGEQPGQAVGYLEDGTMIVVDNAVHRIGDDAQVEVVSSLQTSAGRLIFARLADEDEGAETGGTTQGGGAEPSPTDDPPPTTQSAQPTPAPGAAGGKPVPRGSPRPPKPPARSVTGRNPRR